MNLENAIGVLRDGSELSRPWLLEHYEEALELGIEALKRIGDMRKSPSTTADAILLGETE